MGTGPEIGAEAEADLTLTELIPEGEGYLVRADSPRGAELLASLETEPAGEEDRKAAHRILAGARERIRRTMDATEASRTLGEIPEHPRWDEVAGRCLACSNCTMVCPTCFCTDVSDRVSLDGDRATRVREWDSCFTSSFSYIHGGTIRDSTRARYRQWLTHKLSTWWPQFGTSGCVGCGRCITWCPPGIDLTEEVRHLLGEAPGGEGEGG
jgi:ferredoxin